LANGLRTITVPARVEEALAAEAGQEIPIGRIGAVRPSRRPLSRSPQDEEFSQCNQRLILIMRSAQRARLEGRKTVPPSYQFLPSLRAATFPVVKGEGC
jgi:hypothetical protein